jgi:hypothetical protein
MRPERDRSAVLGEAATVVALVFGFRLGGELLGSIVEWLVRPAPGVLETFGVTVANALATSLAWGGIVVAAAYVYLRVTRYRETTPDPEERPNPRTTRERSADA